MGRANRPSSRILMECCGIHSRQPTLRRSQTIHVAHPSKIENNCLDGSVMFPRESELQTTSPNQYAIGACNEIGNLKDNVQNSTSFPPFQGFRKPFLLVIVSTTKQQ